MSDTLSEMSSPRSSVVGGVIGGTVVEEVGRLPLLDFAPRRLVMLNYTLAGLSDDGRLLLLGELRTRGGDDWALAGRSITSLVAKPAGSPTGTTTTTAGEERRYLDLALVHNAQASCISVVFLVERKNKERYLTSHNIRHSAKLLTLEDEFASYDKVNVLGKGVSHLASSNEEDMPSIFSISNLIRKLRLEDGGTSLRPTAARAQVPTEGQDGTIAAAVHTSQKSGKAVVAVAFKTKSAGKNKFMIDWFQSNKKDELVCLKMPLKLAEDCEPVSLLSLPSSTAAAAAGGKGGGGGNSAYVYALCANKSAGTTSLHKLSCSSSSSSSSPARKPDDPITTFNFEVEVAAMGMSAEQNIPLLLVCEHPARDWARIYTVQKAEGFRGRHPICSRCPDLERISSPAHVVSCVSQRWQLTSSAASAVLASVRSGSQLALATLLQERSSFVAEPESGLAYRLRIVGCETQSLTPIAILMEDLERTFEGAEDRLATATLKVCLSQPPCGESLSQLSGWLMSGRLGLVELHYVSGVGGSGASEQPLETGGSDRFVAKAISADKFRGFVTDTDWTQMSQRQGTFTLDQTDAAKSRIPRISSASSPAVAAAPSGSNAAGLREVGVGLADCLKKVQKDEEALSSNIFQMRKTVDSLQILLEKAQQQQQQQEQEEEKEEEEEDSY